MSDTAVAASGYEHDLVELSTEIVSAYVSHNSVSVTDLPKLIADVHGALRALQTNEVQAPVEELKPAVPVRISVAADYPMVAPNYSATRSKLAKDNGLGRKAA